MVLCFDIDNVLNDLTDKTLALYNLRTGKNIQMSEITAYSFYDCLSKEDADRIIALFKEKELWDSLKPLPGAQEGLKKLMKQGHQIYLATATDPVNFEWKVNWIERYFPFIPSDNVIRIINKSLLNVDVLTDDCLSNLTDTFCDRVVLDRPWNRSTSKDYAYNIRRAKSWTDIVNIMNDINKEMKKWER